MEKKSENKSSWTGIIATALFVVGVIVTLVIVKLLIS